MDAESRLKLAEQTFPGQLNQLARIGEFVAEAARQMDMDDRDIFAIQMAVDEAATNVMLHGYDEDKGSLRVTCWQRADDFVVEIRDRGRPFDPNAVPEPDLYSPLEERREGGLGIYLMRRMMDQVDFSREGDVNVVCMVRHRTPTAGAGANAVIVSPSGRIDATNAAHLEKLLREAIQGTPRFLVIDMSAVTYISSSGLRVLLVVAKQMGQHGGQLMLCCAQASVARVLKMTGFGEIFPLFDTRQAALHASEAQGA